MSFGRKSDSRKAKADDPKRLTTGFPETLQDTPQSSPQIFSLRTSPAPQTFSTHKSSSAEPSALFQSEEDRQLMLSPCASTCTRSIDIARPQTTTHHAQIPLPATGVLGIEMGAVLTELPASEPPRCLQGPSSCSKIDPSSCSNMDQEIVQSAPKCCQHRERSVSLSEIVKQY